MRRFSSRPSAGACLLIFTRFGGIGPGGPDRLEAYGQKGRGQYPKPDSRKNPPSRPRPEGKTLEPFLQDQLAEGPGERVDRLSP